MGRETSDAGASEQARQPGTKANRTRDSVARPARYLTDATDYFRLSEIATCCISVPGAWIEIDCELSLVLTASSAEMMPDTRTLMLLPRALPSMLPPTWRVDSDQVPETAPLL